jgi:hypothetical protein
VPNNHDLNIIPLAVQAAESIGIPQKDLVPVYQAFGGGGYASWILPTAAQEQAILSEWGSVLPNPAFDYAYSWRTQQGDAALGQDPALQQVFAAHNNGGSTAPVVRFGPACKRRDGIKLGQGRLAEFRVRKLHRAIERE